MEAKEKRKDADGFHLSQSLSLSLQYVCKGLRTGIGAQTERMLAKRKRKTRPITCPHSPDLKKPGWRRELSTRESPDWSLRRTRKLRGTVPRSSDAPARAPLLPRHVGSGAGPPARRNKSLEKKDKTDLRLIIFLVVNGGPAVGLNDGGEAGEAAGSWGRGTGGASE